MGEYYVYAHVGLKTNQVFYIGAGKGARCYDKRHNKEWIKRESSENGRRVVKIVESIKDKQTAMKVEQSIIDLIGLDNLTNQTSNRGNLSSFKKGQIPWNKGLKNCQERIYKPVRCNGVSYSSVDEAINSIGIGKTTFYRWVKKGLIEYL